ncbi:hypothetical protein [Micromonospora sp. RTP1Z1]|uniref:hypothetical protein n=1 Tax=Micromonospora sp. RTP1Z1 TaxID=2994043 RepID=UPI0029C79F86|nr:hypothetical protein [Micromonospora sp. RTP1Z1]
MTTPDAPAADPDAATATPPQVRRMIVLMFANLALSALLAGLMLVFQEQLLDYQLAHLDLPAGADLAAARETLRSSAWSRVLPVAVVALAYLVVIRGLRLGRRKAYRQVIFISVIVLVGSGLTLLQPFPWWVRAINVAKALVVVALLLLASRPQVRDRFAATRRPDLVDGFPS